MKKWKIGTLKTFDARNNHIPMSVILPLYYLYYLTSIDNNQFIEHFILVDN